MFASLAEYERSRLSERTKAGLAAATAPGGSAAALER
ncbi:MULTISPECIES: recombinase family protein [unclassified Pseudarthrobacter]